MHRSGLHGGFEALLGKPLFLHLGFFCLGLVILNLWLGRTERSLGAWLVIVSAYVIAFLTVASLTS